MPTKAVCAECGQQPASYFLLPQASREPLCIDCTNRLLTERREQAMAGAQARHERQTARRKAGAS